MKKKFPIYRQLDVMDCGPTCLRMIAEHYGLFLDINRLRQACGVSREGVSLMGISQAAEEIGFATHGAKLSMEQLVQEVPLPCIAHWNQQHFVVVVRATRRKILVADPMNGLLEYTPAQFATGWALATLNDGQKAGITLLLEPNESFAPAAGTAPEASRSSVLRLLEYLTPHHPLVWQLVWGVVAGALLQLLLPFLTQAIVDVGINTHNLSFIYVVLMAQAALALGKLTADFVRGWLLLHISARINVTILSNFLGKVTRLHMSYFDVKMFGDFMQRISDQRRIESFLTGPSLESIFSLLNLVFFSIVLLYFNRWAALVFLLFTLAYFVWTSLFLRLRRKLDTTRFQWDAREQGLFAELLHGMQEIKLANAERYKRWQWEEVRAHIFRISNRALALAQFQTAGGRLLHEGKNVLILLLVAKAVVSGSMTLGGMLAVQYIVGQINGPIEQLVSFFQASQDASLSLERLDDVHNLPDEVEDPTLVLDTIPPYDGLLASGVGFAYAGSPPVLRDITLSIPRGKTTAIVGTSGSGKTTLLKLLLKTYEPTQGRIMVGQTDLRYLHPAAWRHQCGVVMQEGFIFSASIAENIALGTETLDLPRLQAALRTANLEEFVYTLPLSYNTKIGTEGSGLSQGQKQRILIARAVYKDPEVIFFDEATNALDASNENAIMRNLQQFLAGRTVIVVAHRLSTVKHADQIVVLHKGSIVEQGTHATLLAQQGAYHKLVKDQLEVDA